MIFVNGSQKTDFGKQDNTPKIYQVTADRIGRIKDANTGQVKKMAARHIDEDNIYFRKNEDGLEEMVAYCTQMPRELKTKSGRTHQLYLVNGRTTIVWVNGVFKATTADQKWWFDNHPANASNPNRDPNKVARFYEVNENKQAEKFNKDRLRKFEAEQYLYDDSKRLTEGEMRDMCRAFQLDNVDGMSMEVMQHRLSEIIANTNGNKEYGVDKFLGMVGQKQYKTRALIREAMDKEIIYFDRVGPKTKNCWCWRENKMWFHQIIPGQDPINSLEQHLTETSEGATVLSQLMKDLHKNPQEAMVTGHPAGNRAASVSKTSNEPVDEYARLINDAAEGLGPVQRSTIRKGFKERMDGVKSHNYSNKLSASMWEKGAALAEEVLKRQQ